MRLFLSIFILVLSSTAYADDTLRIVNIRVGQGDATLIQGPTDGAGGRVNVLFDAGDIPERDGGNILRAVLKRYGVEKLDYMIVSHDDADHLGGLAYGGRVHGKSFILGFDDAPGCPGDDDNDGQADWLGDEPFLKQSVDGASTYVRQI